MIEAKKLSEIQRSVIDDKISKNNDRIDKNKKKLTQLSYSSSKAFNNTVVKVLNKRNAVIERYNELLREQICNITKIQEDELNTFYTTKLKKSKRLKEIRCEYEKVIRKLNKLERVLTYHINTMDNLQTKSAKRSYKHKVIRSKKKFNKCKKLSNKLEKKQYKIFKSRQFRYTWAIKKQAKYNYKNNMLNNMYDDYSSLLVSARSRKDKTKYQRKIASLDKKINKNNRVLRVIKSKRSHTFIHTLNDVGDAYNVRKVLAI